MSALDAFWVAPSGALLAALNVKQLNSVAKHYSIDVTLPKGAKKSQLLDCILTCLIDRDVLPDERLPEDSKGASGSDSEPTSDSERTSSSKVGRRLRKRSSELTFEQQVELLKLQHDLQVKQKTLEWEQEIERKRFDDELAQKRLDKELDHKRLEAAQKDKDRELELERFKNLEQEREIERTRLQLVAEGKLGKSTSQQSGLANCNYCFGKNHWKINCPVLLEHKRGKGEEGKFGLCSSSVPAVRSAKTVGREQGIVSIDEDLGNVQCDETACSAFSMGYAPFVAEGSVALIGDIAFQLKFCVILGHLKVSFASLSCLSHLNLIQEISFPVPLHKIQLFSGFVNGEVTIAVRPSLPIEGIDLIVGNNFAHNCVFPDQVSPPPVVKTEVLEYDESDKCKKDFPDVFTACTVMRAMTNKQDANSSDVSKNTSAQVFIPQLPVPLSRSDIAEAQRIDQSLKKYFDLTADDDLDRCYVVKDGLLLRRRSPNAGTDVREMVWQVVMPEKFREVTLKTAHGETAGHFGVKKTYNCYNIATGHR
ncbi:hypothetical protein N1851_031064 [Merluccius polli]|uniref:Uncharacterized protein n=1 Tax=Merluccius polli TaxID=89951 RepID=A0AA47M4I3_MERPO|nr:hypothetical protein N1851_031064 [Merluccius polli]